MSADLDIIELGLLSHADAYAIQERLRDERARDEIADTLLLCEHYPVYTHGRRSTPADLPMGADWYRMQGVEVVEVDRGGRATYHGPGQLVGYPIMRVVDVVAHLRTMEQAIVAALADEGVEAHGRSDEGPDYTGVWVGERKIASLGVHVAKGITTHGFAVNVQNDLQPFEWVVPCGLEGVRMTSLLRELGTGGDPLPGFREHMTRRFAEAVGAR